MDNVSKLYPNHDDYYICLMKTEFIDKNGKKKEWHWVKRKDDKKAVVVVAYLLESARRLVLVKEYRHAIADYEIALPAGLIDDNESPLKTAERELFEETNLSVNNFIWQSPFLDSSAGMTNESFVMVHVEAEGEVSNKNCEATEQIEPFTVTKKEARALIDDIIETGKRIDSKAWFVLLMFAVGDI